MKRIIDFLFSLIGLVILIMPFIFIALLIKIKMPGPVFFVQSRVGRNGKLFKLFKFRTMSVASGKTSGSFDAGDSSRITPLGSVLRKTKMDELPQLINVLVGDMSIVGPRPEVQQWTQIYPDQWKIVHRIRPGITDNASIMFRNEEEILANSQDPTLTYKEEILPKKLRMYIDYVENHSVFMDAKIILTTIKEIIIK
ncbi:sugar transferase [Flavobacterium sp. LHD-80]|uniref:sugar transferase n=1 Tax=Flavobacterium sp. LHD-80 TaxID=3071411 RepID=UPI0027DF64FE|nr:sugar transferase [Flavobacterium sp. LHD-80]MDQ6472062.1 sugar transferase [Flavobacterium sp. LHD-80]